MKDNGANIMSELVSYHRVQLKAPFTPISVDIMGTRFVKASTNLRALIIIWSLTGVSLATGYLTDVMLDNITSAAVIRSLWVLQMHNNT